MGRRVSAGLSAADRVATHSPHRRESVRTADAVRLRHMQHLAFPPEAEAAP